jgi:hypothetical protein
MGVVEGDLKEREVEIFIIFRTKEKTTPKSIYIG